MLRSALRRSKPHSRSFCLCNGCLICIPPDRQRTGFHDWKRPHTETAKQRDQARKESTVGSKPFKLLHLEDHEPPPRQIRQATDRNGKHRFSGLQLQDMEGRICAARVIRARKAVHCNHEPSSDSEHSHTETPVSAEADADRDLPARPPAKHASSGHEALLRSRYTHNDGCVS